MKRNYFLVIAFFFVFLINFQLNAQCSGTATSNATGNWTGAIWTYTGGATSPNNACTIIISAAHTVTVSSNQQAYGNVQVNGNLVINNQLRLGTTTGCGLTLRIYGSGQLSTASGGSSDRLYICGATIITGQPSPPPTAIDWPADNSFSAGDVGGSGLGFGESGVLPIELLFFNASEKGGQVNINWATASELNFDFFDIEKSSDGTTFHSIATVKGNGTTNLRHDYSFTDEKPLIGKNYYRLKSVDFDGYTEYFKIVMVDFDGKKDFSVNPNPSDGIALNIETNFTPLNKGFVVVYNAVGAVVARFEVSGSASMLTMPVKLESGVYFAKYISSGFTSTNRVVVK
jgi:hypothetical protein